MRASPSCGQEGRARRRRRRRSRRRSTSPVGLPARTTCVRPGVAQGGDQRRRPTRRTPRRCRPGRRPAARRTPRARSSTPSVGPATSTATPPAANRLVAKVARAVCAATVPMVARKTGRGGGLVAQRLERRAVAADAGRARAAASRSGSVSPRFGNSLTPVSGRVRWATWSSRAATTASIRAGSEPSSRAARTPPASSIRPSSAQAGAGEVVGELLDGVGAAGRVGDLGDVGLARSAAS